jgi:glycosyltransferase involved in cell wall biosynthesis
MVPKLKELGFDVTFVTSCAPGFREQCPDYVKVYDYPVKRGFDFVGTIRSAFRFKRLCKQEHFDMVIYSTINASLYCAYGAKHAHVPVRVKNQWGMRYVGFEGWKRVLVRCLEKYTCTSATDIRNVSEKNKALSVADGLYKPDKCKVVGKGGTIGIDLSLYDLKNKDGYRQSIREQYGIPQEALLYCFVGRIREDKGVGELLTAFERINTNHPNTWLMMLGDIEATGALLGLLEKLQTNKQIVFCGFVPKQKVMECISASDVLVHPTYREGFGMVLQEAAAMELPTITTDIPGASEAIENGITGLLAKKQDVNTLYDCMEKMLDEPLRIQYGKAGRKRIETDFERNMMVDRLCKDWLAMYYNRIEQNAKNR